MRIVFVTIALALAACGGSAGNDGGDDAPPITDSDGSGLVLRVNQVGYATGAPKTAYLMAPTARDAATFHVVDNNGRSALEGSVGASAGAWNAAFPFVYPIDLTTVTDAGTYHLVAGDARSPDFKVETSPYGAAFEDTITFFVAQRDGSDVDTTVLARKPSHLLDATASSFKTPAFDSDGALEGTLGTAGAKVDVSGGWFDAGDYLKFVETTSYVEVMMLLVARDEATPDPRLLAEAKRGLDWLLRMWDDGTGTLYYQVGIGDGNDNILGDHDVWRLPEADDVSGAQASPGDDDFFVSHRPVLRAATAGSPVSPNLAGRLAAAFALGAQLFPEDKAKCLAAAEHVYDLADASAATLLTAAPFDFYPETDGVDDLELGATELANAVAAGGLPSGLPHTDPMFYLTSAAGHASSIAADGATEPLNLYEVGGLAHVELSKALAAAGNPTVSISPADLAAALEAKLADAEAKHDDPFGFAAGDDGDPVPHALGLAIEATLADDLASSTTHAALAQRQLDWVLGANAWGTSFIIGEGTTFPHCPQHQVANLAGALDGTSPILVGATVDGFGDPGDVTGQDPIDGAHECMAGDFAAFDTADEAYRDAVEDFATTEPADDYTATALVAFALASR